MPLCVTEGPEQRTVNILPICVPRQPAVTDAISCGSRSHHAAFILFASCRGSANAEDRPAGCSNVQRQVPGILSRTRHGSTRQRWLNSSPWTLLHANRDSGRTGEVALDAHVWARRGVEDSRGARPSKRAYQRPEFRSKAGPPEPAVGTKCRFNCLQPGPQTHQ